MLVLKLQTQRGLRCVLKYELEPLNGVWVFLSAARFIFISFALQDHFIRNGIPASNEYSDLIPTANYRE